MLFCQTLQYVADVAIIVVQVMSITSRQNKTTLVGAVDGATYRWFVHTSYAMMRCDINMASLNNTVQFACDVFEPCHASQMTKINLMVSVMSWF